jgi:hypothetical protein
MTEARSLRRPLVIDSQIERCNRGRYFPIFVQIDRPDAIARQWGRMPEPGGLVRPASLLAKAIPARPNHRHARGISFPASLCQLKQRRSTARIKKRLVLSAMPML